MTEMVGDEEIYEGFEEEPFTPEEQEAIKTLMCAWADAADTLPKEQTTVRIVFGACVNAIGTMGPAYCRIAAATLLHRANEIDREEDTIQ